MLTACKTATSKTSALAAIGSLQTSTSDQTTTLLAVQSTTSVRTYFDVKTGMHQALITLLMVLSKQTGSCHAGESCYAAFMCLLSISAAW